MPVDRNDPDYARHRRKFLVGYDRAVPKMRQANRCIGCGECTPKCPQGINIVRQLQRVDRFVEDLKQGRDFDRTNYFWSR